MEGNRENDPTLYALEQILLTLGGYAAPIEPASSETVQPSPSVEVVVPGNIHQLLDNALEDAGLPGGSTVKYRVRGHPDLLIRYNSGISVAEGRTAHEAARTMGLPIVPVEYIEHGGEAYGVTLLVDGRPFDEVLAQERSPEHIEAADDVMATIATSLMQAQRSGAAWPTDVQTPGQFMWGTLAGDTGPRLWLVDPPLVTYTITDPDEYGIELLYDISGLLYAERAAGQELPRARQAFGRAVVECPDSARYGDGFRRAGAHCLLNRQNMHELPGDEYRFVDNFRTY